MENPIYTNPVLIYLQCSKGYKYFILYPMQHIFYKYDLSLTQKIELLKEAKDKSHKWWVDILDCSKSFARQKVEMGLEEILGKLKDDSHFTVIHRHDHIEGEYLEVGFRTMDRLETSYFLWIYCTIDNLSYFISKYDLKLLENPCKSLPSIPK